MPEFPSSPHCELIVALPGWQRKVCGDDQLRLLTLSGSHSPPGREVGVGPHSTLLLGVATAEANRSELDCAYLKPLLGVGPQGKY